MVAAGWVGSFSPATLSTSSLGDHMATSPGGKPNQILEPPQLARSKQRSSGSTSSSLRMSELLTLSPRQSPASLQKELDPQSYSFGDYPQWSGATPTELLTTRQTPSLMNKTPKYLASFTWGRGLTPLTTSVFQ